MNTFLHICAKIPPKKQANFCKMKYSLLIFIVFITLFKGQSQHNIPDIQLEASVLYLGIPNFLRIDGYNHDKSSLVLEIAGIDFESHENGKFTVLVPENTSMRVLSAKLYADKKKSKLLAQKFFKIMDLPTPTASILGGNSGKLKSVLLSHLRKIDNCIEYWDTDIRAKITEFTLMLHDAEGVKLIKNLGDEFSPEQKIAISELKVGDYLIIKDIKSQMPGGASRRLNDIVYEIIE